MDEDLRQCVFGLCVSVSLYARFFPKAAEEQAEAAFEFLDQDGSGTIGIKVR